MSKMESLKGFRTLSPDERRAVAAATREQEASKGTVLFRQGQAAEGVWAVKTGVVHIIKSGPDGREIVIEVIPSGELFGAIVALEKRPYPASAMAAEDSVIWRLPASLARSLCQKYPTLRSAIMEQVSTRLRSAHDRLRSVALEPVEQRLARLLLTLVQKIGRQKDGMALLNVTRRELAEMIGTTVETAIRVISKWQRAGIVRTSRQEISLADPVALNAIADGKEPTL